MFDDATRAGDAGEPARLRRRVRGPRREHQHGARRAAGRCCATSSRSRATCRAAARSLKRFFNELGDAARIVAPAAESQAEPVREPGHDVRRARRGRQAVHPGVDQRGPRVARRRRSGRSRSSGRSCATPRACSASCARACAALRTAAPDLADAFEMGTPHAEALAAVQPPPRLAAAGAAAFANDPVAPRGVKRLAETLEVAQPDAADYLAPAQLQCNYVTLWFRNVSSLLSEGDVHGTWQRFIIIATPQGPNNEGGPSSAPANGPTRRQLPALEPVPEHGVARPAEGVRGGQRAVPGRPQGDRQRARQAAGDATEGTK